MINHFLTIPGFGSSGPAHWQTIWEDQYKGKFSRLEQRDWENPEKTEWVENLQNQVQNLTEPTILIAHSLGCLTVVHWAAKYSSDLIKGAFLVAPADAEQDNFPEVIKNFSPVPTLKIAFPTILVASTNDEYSSIKRAEFFAESWGSHFINIGDFGHINAHSGLGDWQAGKNIFTENFSIRF
ncbi:hypothetical protein SAMN04515674_12211 [Pseudarcicella hirudinis]|uniref:Alpha/beta hydrolase n=1 Tax=Pseudarcicella hirudinis TaxID=1079859 RepID=A0A1I5YX13_9BACT|nr:alpha/beta hydrolase [Pseudarcicella hirudinis]SFQ48357.1 hypothetical protein SAMN04515674_12211 [Pseudarcicella hirudinis]